MGEDRGGLLLYVNMGGDIGVACYCMLPLVKIGVACYCMLTLVKIGVACYCVLTWWPVTVC